nr:hypothetical protein [uncultured Nitratireductor sp.]
MFVEGFDPGDHYPTGQGLANQPKGGPALCTEAPVQAFAAAARMSIDSWRSLGDGKPVGRPEELEVDA